ncbi:hypothetical protein, partial [Ralstonia pseudosolanacearum]|uniref:hypothetical protein n=1 Tax=Ralstonia pseudosolanacearum TaxID=1310165 RepID=UPI003C7A9C7D
MTHAAAGLMERSVSGVGQTEEVAPRGDRAGYTETPRLAGRCGWTGRDGVRAGSGDRFAISQRRHGETVMIPFKALRRAMCSRRCL